MKRRRSAAAVLLALALPALAAPGAQASKHMELALQDDSVFVDQQYMDRDTALDHAEKLHVKRIRVNVLWARTLVDGGHHRTLPETGPVYDFSRIDALEAAAGARGIKLQLTLTGPAPAWATANHKVGPDRPSAKKFGEFVRTVATHFEGRVDRYAIWNEPNLRPWLAPTKRAPKLYRALYTTGYKAIKAVDRDADVLIGEVSPTGDSRAIPPLKFLRGVTCSKRNYKAARRCAPLKADGFALHPYQLTAAPQRAFGRRDDVPISRLSRLTKALDKLARRRALRTPRGHALDLYLTEFGYLSAGSRKVKPQRRARWMNAAYKIARRNPRVRQLLQYQLVDPPRGERWHSALLDRRGKPQPVYGKLARASRR
jgi:hypothetical protein